MNGLKIFNNEQFGQVRIIEKDGESWFIAKEVANILDYSKTANMLERLDEDDKIKLNYSDSVSIGLENVNSQGMYFINESGLYSAILGSKKAEAKQFKKWITLEVIPTIRKTGGYVANEDLFVDTYLPFADETTKTLFKSTLEVVKNQNVIILKQKQEIKHKEDVIIGLVDEISLAEKRQILNRVVRKTRNYQERWNELYKNFEMKYHINLGSRLESYNQTHKPKLKNKLDYIDKVMNKIPEIYEIACKLYENDVKALVEEMYRLNNAV